MISLTWNLWRGGGVRGSIAISQLNGVIVLHNINFTNVREQPVLLHLHLVRSLARSEELYTLKAGHSEGVLKYVGTGINKEIGGVMGESSSVMRLFHR